MGRTTSLKCARQKTASLISTVFEATSVMAVVVAGTGVETKSVKTQKRPVAEGDDG